MKKINIILFTVFVGLALSACWNGSVLADYIRIDNASVLDEQLFSLSSLDGTVLVKDMPGNSVNVTLIDSLLFLVDANGEKLIHIYSIHENRFIGNYGSRGRGPNEVLSMGQIHEGREKGTAGGYDITQRRWLEFSVPETLQNGTLVVKNTTDIPGDKDIYYVQGPFWMNDREFVSTGLRSYENRCFITDTNLDSYLEFVNPDITFRKDLPDNILADTYSSYLSVKPDKSSLVLGGRYYRFDRDFQY